MEISVPLGFPFGVCDLQSLDTSGICNICGYNAEIIARVDFKQRNIGIYFAQHVCPT